MNSVVYFLVALMLWETNFKDKKVEVKQLQDYQITINDTQNGIVLKGNPEEEGFSSAWFYIPENIEVGPGDTLVVKLKVVNNTVRLRYFLLSKDKRVYLLGIKYVPESEKWQEIEIPLKNAKPFYSSNFPWSLVPDKKPSMYIFLENQNPGKFEVEIESVRIKGGIEK